jgi:regulator of cell morphogenesis and NO signaling
MIDANTTMIRDLVADDFRTATVFQKHGLDFCCGGGRTIAEACATKGIDAGAVVVDLAAVAATPPNGTPKFNLWELDLLIDYIVANHHGYVREVLPTVLQHVQKVARVHGDNHPEVIAIADSFLRVAQELTGHMQKEEMMLFPFIKAMVAAHKAGSPMPSAPFGTVGNPIRMMQAEHESAGNEMHEISVLTNDYTPPEDACTTYRVSFQELRAFELDLHQHVHLENNILFPKAVALEQELLSAVA